TFRVTDLNAGAASSDPQNLTMLSSGVLCFTANDGVSAKVFRLSVPTADAGGPYAVSPGWHVTLHGSGNAFDSTDSTTLQWDLDGDGVFGESGAAAARGDE